MDFLSADSLPWLQGAQTRMRSAHAAQRLPHSLLLLSVPGLGAEQLAYWITALALCEAPGPRPCGGCASCRLLRSDSHPDSHIVRLEEDAQQIKVDQVRGLIESLSLKSYRGGYKVGVIEGAEALNANGANAFLKTLEEPTADTVLIMIARPSHRLPATIASRCLRLVLTPPPTEAAVAWLLGHAQAYLNAGANDKITADTKTAADANAAPEAKVTVTKTDTPAAEGMAAGAQAASEKAAGEKTAAKGGTAADVRVDSQVRTGAEVKGAVRASAAAAHSWHAALALAGGAPLRALELAEVGIAGLDADMRESLRQLAAGSVDVTLLADRWMKSDPALRLAWLENWITQRVHEWTTAGTSGQSAEPVRLPAALLKAKIRALFELLDAARDLRRLASTGMNQQLALEALLLGGRAALAT